MKANWVNKCHIEGRIFSHTLQKKVSGENSKNPGTPFIRGQINVATDDNGINIVPVSFTYITPTYNSGKKNETYDVLEQIINQDITWEKNGKDQAPAVRIDGDVEVNDFLGRDGNMVESKRVRGRFVHFASGPSGLNPKEDERNTFETDMLIAAVSENEEGEYINIRGYAFGYRGALIPVTYTVRIKDGISYFLGQDISNANPLLTKVWGNIISTTQEVKTETESAFGGPVVNITTRTLRAWEVTGANPEPYEWDSEGTLTIDEFKKLLVQREETKAAAKERAEAYQATRQGGAGFPASGSENEEVVPWDATKKSDSPTSIADFKF